MGFLMKKFAIAASLAALTLAASSAAQATTVLTFEGVGNQASVNDFYNGGTDSAGNTGTNYGINFTSASLGLIDSDAGGTGNFANEPSASTIVFFLSGSAATMNVAAGFTTGFSFFYSAFQDAFVNVYDGLNGTGNLLATLNLSTNFNNGGCVGDPTGQACHWDAVGVTFLGTAHSVDFGGVANQAGFDNITLGSAIAGGVPEPSIWALMIGGFGLVGTALRRRRVLAAAL
jgi:hypothetical protein